MANYAFVEDTKIVGVYDLLPKNWRNVSNFNLLSDSEIETFSWYKLEKIIPDYNTATHKLGNPTYDFIDNVAYETMTLVEIIRPEEPATIRALTDEELELQRQQEQERQWTIVRETRDKLMKDFEWRYSRYDRQVRLELQTTDDIVALDLYMQQLADITTQSDPYQITWPAILE